MNKIEKRLWEAMIQEGENILETNTPYTEVDRAKAAAKVSIDFAREAWRSGFVRSLVESQQEEEHSGPVNDAVFPPTFEQWLEKKL